MPSGRIPQATISLVRSRVDLVRIVEESGVALRRTGKNFVGKCPFHQDDTPSFSVSPDNQFYKCFGCGAGGTVFTYVENREQITFPEAVRKLAARAGIPVAEEEDGRSGDEQDIAAANRFAREHFHERLMDADAGKPAREYLLGRGITLETMGELTLGFAPEGWDGLLTVMTDAGFSVDALLAAGLLRENDRGRRYDYFRNRIIFPIHDPGGRPVAFGGRALDDATPKYLNSPETAVYTKGNVLYFLDRARRPMQDSRMVLVAEGYMDVIVLYQAGVRNAVASLGTALSDTHARLLKRYTDEVCFVFDGDEAGIRAVERGAPQFLREGFRTKVVTLPPGQDPDDFVRAEGAEAFQSRVADAASLIDFRLNRLARERDFTDPETKVAVIADMADLLRHVRNPIVLREYADRLRRELSVDARDLWRELRSHKVQVPAGPVDPSSSQQQAKPRLLVEKQLLTLLMSEPQHILGVFESISPYDFEGEPHQELGKVLWELARDGAEVDPHTLMETCFDDSLRELVAGMMTQSRSLPNVEEEIRDHVDKMVRDSLRRAEQQYLSNRLGEGDADELAVAKEMVELSKQRRGETAGGDG
ncbi:DNA primase [Candidatus Poribacteria bacterium]|nr:DNA primase [Candidatus Poribacteria bacterium]